MGQFRLLAALSLLLVFGPRGHAQEAPESPVPVAVGRNGDIPSIFKPAGATEALRGICGPILLCSQLGSVALVIGVLLARMRSETVPLDAVAGMMLKVAFIASIPLWQGLTQQTVDALSEGLARRQYPANAAPTCAVGYVAPEAGLSDKLFSLEKHWRLPSSPMLDSLEGRLAPIQGAEESWLSRGWNWARSSHLAATPDADARWAVAADVSRAELVQRTVWGVCLCVQGCEIAGFLAEMLRLLLFHGGFALAPLWIACLGGGSLHALGVRGLVGLAGIALWPVGWAVANVCTVVMLDPALGVLGNCAGSAMYPELPQGVTRTVALAAPYLSWSLLGMLVAITLALCAWILGTLVLVPFALHKILGSTHR